MQKVDCSPTRAVLAFDADKARSTLRVGKRNAFSRALFHPFV